MCIKCLIRQLEFQSKVLPPEELAKTKAVILAQIKEKLHNKAKRLNKIEEFDLIIENTDIMDELARIDKKITGLK